MSRRRKHTDGRKYTSTVFGKGDPNTNKIVAEHSFKVTLIYFFGMIILLAAFLASLYWFVETNPTTGRIEMSLEDIKYKGPVSGVLGLALILWITYARKITDTYVK